MTQTLEEKIDELVNKVFPYTIQSRAREDLTRLIESLVRYVEDEAYSRGFEEGMRPEPEPRFGKEQFELWDLWKRYKTNLSKNQEDKQKHISEDDVNNVVEELKDPNFKEEPYKTI